MGSSRSLVCWRCGQFVVVDADRRDAGLATFMGEHEGHPLGFVTVASLPANFYQNVRIPC